MKRFTVLSHNVFWFQGVPFPTDRPAAPDMDIVERLCAIYQEVNADVICLQEIQNRETFAVVSRRLGMPGCFCPGMSLPQYGGALFWHRHRGRPLRNSQKSVVETQRMWQTLEVTGSHGGVKIGNVHLPSERQLGRERATAQRLAELGELIGSPGRGLDIIVGDCNEGPDGPVGQCLGCHGYVDAAVLAGRADLPTTIAGGRGDYAWVRKELGDCVLSYDVVGKQDFVCGVEGKDYLSDHLPLWITVEPF